MELNKIGTGVLVADLEPGSAEWLEIRKTGITGSDVAAIVGVSKWTSALACWAKKLGKIDDELTQSEPMYWGTTLEPIIRNHFIKTTGWQVQEVGTYAHQDRPWQLANPDGIIVKDTGELALLEIKTARFEDDWIVPAENTLGSASGVPRHYRTQVQHYLDVFDLPEAYVAVLFGGSKFRIFHVPADAFEQEANREACERFMGNLATETKPDWDGSTSTYETIRVMHPEIDTTTRVELGDLGIHLANKAAELNELEQQLTELKSRTIDAMGNARDGIVSVDGLDVVVAQRAARNGGTPYLVIKTKGQIK